MVSWSLCFVFIPGFLMWCFFFLFGNRLAVGEIDECFAYFVILENLSSVCILSCKPKVTVTSCLFTKLSGTYNR